MIYMLQDINGNKSNILVKEQRITILIGVLTKTVIIQYCQPLIFNSCVNHIYITGCDNSVDSLYNIVTVSF